MAPTISDTAGLAPQLGDIEAKCVMEEVVDDCELIAQDFSAKIDSPTKVPLILRAEPASSDRW